MALSLSNFINKYTGVADVGTTPENTGECVGLVMKWFKEQGLPTFYGNAKDLVANAPRDSYEVIYNTPFNSPKPGDVLVFNGNFGGGYGHTGIVTEASVWSFKLFEQNYPYLGAKPNIGTHPTSHYFSVVGWIRPKVVLTKEQQMLAIINSSISDSDFRNKVRSIYGV